MESEGGTDAVLKHASCANEILVLEPGFLAFVFFCFCSAAAGRLFFWKLF